jgi:hypothetical protein
MDDFLQLVGGHAQPASGVLDEELERDHADTQRNRHALPPASANSRAMASDPSMMCSHSGGSGSGV